MKLADFGLAVEMDDPDTPVWYGEYKLRNSSDGYAVLTLGDGCRSYILTHVRYMRGTCEVHVIVHLPSIPESGPTV